MQILEYTSEFSVFINLLSKIMIKSNANSLLDNTAILYKQTAPSRHDVCLDKRSFKCKIGENCSNILCIYGQNSNSKFPSTLMEELFIAILLGVCLSCLESNDLLSFPQSNIHNRHVNYLTV